ncbi:MAG: hypothetical protein L6302_05020 [Desulfobacteraceae bacterium]|nr:hypothetical protein [Desulfobacteraceae bacterium]
MKTIEIDFDVFKEITLRRATEKVSHNDVLRELFGLEPKNSSDMSVATAGKSWVTKGVEFPHGTKFRATYKGQIFHATVEDGALVLNGKRFLSPSSAAVSITENPVNGWVFWECRLTENESWQIIKKYRNQ